MSTVAERAAPATPPAPPVAAPPNGRRRRVLALITLGLVVLGILWAAYWFLVLSRRESTDDAYVNGNKVVISARQAGTVIAVLADDTQRVRAGQVLVRLDPTDSEVALARAASNLAETVRRVRQQRETAEQYDSLASSRRIELARAREDLAGREPLIAAHAIAPEDVRHAREAVALAEAGLAQAQRQARAAHALIDGIDLRDNPAVLEAKAEYRDAWIAHSRNAVLAPVSGYVAERGVQLGQRVQAGEALMTVVPLETLWVDANFKEVQLRNLRIGQPATVRSDLYGGAILFHGHVSGMSAGTGAAFALLPPQNASGNWIKVVQRVPVRIDLEEADLARAPLRVGLSTTVTIDTSDRRGPVLAPHEASRPVGVTDVYATDLAAANAEADRIIARNLLGGAS